MTSDAQLLRHLAGLPPDAREWVDFVTKTLKLHGSYAPAAQKVIGQNRWRRLTGKGQNPIAYVKTATMHEAGKMGLAVDRYKPDEPRVITKDRLVPLPVPQTVSLTSQDLCGAIYGDDEVSYQDHLDSLLPQPGPERSIPSWLCTPDGAVNWGLVARHAVLAPRMKAEVARVLRLRAQGWSQPRAIEKLSNPQTLAAAWKWVDMHHAEIAHVLSLEAPPPPVIRQERKRFIPPAQVLRKKAKEPEVLHAGPSLSQVRHQHLPGVPRAAHVVWDGETLSIWHRGSVVTFKNCTIEKAMARLGTLRTTGRLASTFAFLENCKKPVSLTF
jgi:hypothetical protein